MDTTEQPKNADYRRKRELVRPGFQARLILIFAALGCLSVFVQVLLVDYSLEPILTNTADLNAEALQEARKILLGSLVLGYLVILPLMLGIGVLVTFRIAGPVARFEAHLKSIAEGKDVGPCTIREHDEFRSLCDRINEAVTYLRNHGHASEARPTAPAGSHVSVVPAVEPPVTQPGAATGKPAAAKSGERRAA